MSKSATIESRNVKVLMLGNEAIARGAVEAGISFAAAYPGTPSTDIMESLTVFSKEFGFRVEWSVNEKVAFEKAMGVSLCGLRAIVSMKHAGMNWVSDPLSVAVLGGVQGGLVIVTADDPNCHSSANEQDNRFYGMFFKIPVLEPSDPQEAKEMTRHAFEVSEKTSLPVIIRTVTRVSHTRGDVMLGTISQNGRHPSFASENGRFYLTTSRSLARHLWLCNQQEVVKGIVKSLPFNQMEWKGQRTNIVTSGIAYSYVKESLKQLGIEERVGILKVGVVHPSPSHHIHKILENSDVVIVVEEGSPFLEMSVRALSSEVCGSSKIVGKMSKDLPEAGELTVELVNQVISRFVGGGKIRQAHDNLQKEISDILPKRTPTFCAGCPHSASFYVLSKIQRRLKRRKGRIIFLIDIGCYSMSIHPPYEIGDVKYSMGSSLGVAQGLASFLDDKVLAVIGDGTFYHAGIPELLNAVYNKSNLTILIVDNGTIAMTGMQPTPGTGITAAGEKGGKIDIEKIVRGCGVEAVEVIDSYEIEKLEESIMQAIEYPGLSVVVSKNLCAIEQRRYFSKKGIAPPRYRVDKELCTQCYICLKKFSCPAIVKEDAQPEIDESLCIGCSVCSKICPAGAIKMI